MRKQTKVAVATAALSLMCATSAFAAPSIDITSARSGNHNNSAIESWVDEGLVSEEEAAKIEEYFNSKRPERKEIDGADNEEATGNSGNSNTKEQKRPRKNSSSTSESEAEDKDDSNRPERPERAKKDDTSETTDETKRPERRFGSNGEQGEQNEQGERPERPEFSRGSNKESGFSSLIDELVEEGIITQKQSEKIEDYIESKLSKNE